LLEDSNSPGPIWFFRVLVGSIFVAFIDSIVVVVVRSLQKRIVVYCGEGFVGLEGCVHSPLLFGYSGKGFL